MSRPSFLNGVVVAALLAFTTAAVIGALAVYAGTSGALRLVIPGVSLAYLVHLLRSASTRTGSVVTLATWGVIAIATWWVAPPLGLYVLVHAGAIWLVRSLYFYAGIIPAVIDLGLTALAVCIAAWAASRTGSVFLATWCFFLVQALFVSIPKSLRDRRTTRETTVNPVFERARRQANDALRQLAAR
ncbi:MAG: hypothetical protein OEW59_09925 [Gammaproteobacteria bacterium]|nr:hypothetical protein [Gammaproteobacteria bacterium]